MSDNVKRTLILTEAEITDGSGIISDGPKKAYTQKVVPILKENDSYIVIDDEKFTKLQKHGKGDRYTIYPVLNNHSISLNRHDSCWGNRIYYSEYSTSKTRPCTVRRRIERELLTEFGFFMGGIDLSFIM